MSYGSVHIPAGCTVKVGDSVGALTSLGVLKGDANIEITYDLVEVLGSKAETLVDLIKNMRANATFELYQLYLTNIQKLLDGVATVTNTAATIVEDYDQTVAEGSWSLNTFIPLTYQNGDGSVLQIDAQGYVDISAGTDGALTHETHYVMAKNEDGIWGVIVYDTPATGESQALTISYDYTPAASKTMKMGAASDTITAKIVEFSKTIDGKTFRARIWKAKNESGITLAFPDSAGDEPASIPVTLVGRIDEDRTSGEQLIEIYDEIGTSI